jgi:hypothetical protein
MPFEARPAPPGNRSSPLSRFLKFRACTVAAIRSKDHRLSLRRNLLLAISGTPVQPTLCVKPELSLYQ